MKKIVSVLLAVCCMLSAMALAGCGGKGGNKDYDLYIFNSKGENAVEFKEMTEEYGRLTGQKIKVFSIGSGQEHLATLRQEMQLRNKPSIFSVQSLAELIEWKDGGFALDLQAANGGSEFSQLVASIKDDQVLTTDTGSYGIPYGLEGGAYLVDTALLQSIFGDNAAAVLASLKTCLYDDFESFVTTMTKWIKGDADAASVTLESKTYALPAFKGFSLRGVFAVAGYERWTYGDHFVNNAVNAVFATAAEAYKATDAQLDQLTEPLKAYARALDLKTTNMTNTRGNSFVTTSTEYDSTVNTFVQGRALFMEQGNWSIANLSKRNAAIVDTLDIIPMKMPITDAMIKVPGRTAASMAASIPVFVPNYYAINAQVSKDEQKKAMDFLVWLNTSEKGKDYIVNKFNFIPFTADANTTLPIGLNNAVLAYVKAGKTLSDPYHGAPATWATQTLGNYIREGFLSNATWNDNAYDAIAGYALKTWKEQR